jgi:hypothetical protein
MPLEFWHPELYIAKKVGGMRPGGITPLLDGFKRSEGGEILWTGKRLLEGAQVINQSQPQNKWTQDETITHQQECQCPFCRAGRARQAPEMEPRQQQQVEGKVLAGVQLEAPLPKLTPLALSPDSEPTWTEPVSSQALESSAQTESPLIREEEMSELLTESSDARTTHSSSTEPRTLSKDQLQQRMSSMGENPKRPPSKSESK